MNRVAFSVVLAAVTLGPSISFGSNKMETLIFGVEVLGQPPSGSAYRLQKNTPIPFNQTSIPFSDLALFYGVSNPELNMEFTFRLGYRRAYGELSTGSTVNSLPVSGFQYQAVPLGVGTHLYFSNHWVRPYTSIEFGGAPQTLSYLRTDEPQIDSEWNLGFELRGAIGVQLHPAPWIGIRFFVVSTFGSSLLPEDLQPGLNPTRLQGGISIVAKRPGAADQSAIDSSDSEPLLKDYNALSNSNNAGFEWIRRADLARKEGRLIEAEKLYRQGVRLLPKRRDIRKNLEVPVRIDWAQVLREIGRSDEAVKVLKEALAIDPKNQQVKDIYLELVPLPSTP